MLWHVLPVLCLLCGVISRFTKCWAVAEFFPGPRANTSPVLSLGSGCLPGDCTVMQWRLGLVPQSLPQQDIVSTRRDTAGILGMVASKHVMFSLSPSPQTGL